MDQRTIAHYEILEEIGAGGMSVVYRARDTRLDREVAIKALPEELAQDAERLARFEREAKLLASLNHPHIAAIHGLEEADGQPFLILELVEGETLAERIARGPILVEEALELGRQIAEALEAAHGQGVVHRDLKPANVKVTPEGQIKVLDFGLAKALALEPSDPNFTHSPTLTQPMTRTGIILGTAGYMSPEQARAQEAGKQADIWALGCVLYEMLTGERAFRGETVSDTLAAILEREPDWKALPETIPPLTRSLLRRSLEKDANRRLHDIADARLEIEEATALPSSETAAKDIERPALLRRAVPWGIAALMTVVVAVTIYRAGWDRQATGVTRAHLQIVL
ncbi:MAG: serine/threonine-protein kinase, partial [Thermoanaerobaculia bacterium]